MLTEPPPPGLAVVHGVMEEGWICAARRRAGRELWLVSPTPSCSAGASPRPRRAQRSRAVAPEVFFADVTPGDYVVHMEHGIGRFQRAGQAGLRGRWSASTCRWTTPRATGCTCRCIRPTAWPATWAPASSPRRCTAWARHDWEQLKARTRKAVAEIADELLELYAAREVVHGPRLQPRRPLAGRAGGELPLRRDRGPAGGDRGGQARHGAAAARWTA